MHRDNDLPTLHLSRVIGIIALMEAAMDDSGEGRRRGDQAYRDMLERIRDQALRFLQVAPAMESRGEIEVVARTRGATACEPDICSIEMLNRKQLVIVRCHTCKRGGTWRIPERAD